MTIDVVFDGPPGPVSGRFIEVENMQGAGVKVGEWIERENGTWALRLVVVDPCSPETLDQAAKAAEEAYFEHADGTMRERWEWRAVARAVLGVTR